MKRNYKIPECETCGARNKSIFCDLSEHEIDQVDEAKRCNSYGKGQIIFHEGDRVQGIYCVNKGKIKLYQLGVEGKEQIIRFATDGDIIGYRALLSEELLSASAETIEDTIVCFVPKSNILKIIKENTDFNFKLLKELSQELGESAKIITDLAQKPVRERLAEALLMLKDRFELDDNNTIQVKLSREEIANIIGTATETVIRLLSEFKKDGYVSLKGKEITLLNIPALIKTANIYD